MIEDDLRLARELGEQVRRMVEQLHLEGGNRIELVLRFWLDPSGHVKIEHFSVGSSLQ